jgi:signal-transduction protein with cAMP-binding, CBS, and nucleotidyltransferase domain
MLHESYVKMVKTRRIDAVMSKLLKVFEHAPLEELKNLAEFNCVFKEYKIHNYIYRAGSVPKACYLMVKGNVKVDSPGFEVKKMMEMVIVGENTIFG